MCFQPFGLLPLKKLHSVHLPVSSLEFSFLKKEGMKRRTTETQKVNTQKNFVVLLLPNEVQFSYPKFKTFLDLTHLDNSGLTYHFPLNIFLGNVFLPLPTPQRPWT
jgi:hypothetical protein